MSTKNSALTAALPRSSGSINAQTLVADSASAVPTTPPAFANGSVIAGKYLVEETIAEGGTGVVVVARHLALHQRVAIKYLKPAILGSPAVVDRFVREARLAAQITSEHVVSVHDVGTLPDAGPYMVMEYLVGEDLGRTIRGGPLPVARAVDYVLQACDALAEAHSLGIVHRDIKPENLFIAKRASSTPILKIIDFGISKATARNDENANWGRETGVNDRFGTPLYMSPEQLRSTSQVDARTDIWSLGVVLYELLTGSPPFVGDDLPQVCTSIVTGEPERLRARRPAAPFEVEAIVHRCLEKDPKRRFRNMAELARALAPFGPPNATSRAERVAEVVRRGGGSIRPPAPTPGTLDFRSMSVPRITSTDIRAVTTVTVRRVRKREWQTAFATLAGLACAAAVWTILVARRAPAPRAAGGAPFAMEMRVAGALPGSDLPPSPAAAPPLARAEAISIAPPLAPVKPRAPSKPRALASPSSRNSPSASKDRRAQFGERE